jgi:uncharacterized membrane-anchored protein YjiN (DUF445 family)
LVLRKGDVALLVSLVLYAAGWLVFVNYNAHAGEFIRTAGEASLIGGLCDYIALKMLFEKKWYLPNSGVLPRNRLKLVAAIGTTVENEWLTPVTIHRKLTEYDLAARIGRWLEQLSLRDADLTFFEQQAMRLADWIKRPQAVSSIAAELKLEPMVRILERLYLFNAERTVLKFAESLPERFSQLVHDPEFRQYLESELHHLGVQLQTADSLERKHVEAWVEKLLNAAIGASRGEIARLVVENLNRLSDEQIRVQIESKTRPHLEWIRVNGSLFGALFGLGAAFMRSLAPFA